MPDPYTSATAVAVHLGPRDAVHPISTARYGKFQAPSKPSGNLLEHDASPRSQSQKLQASFPQFRSTVLARLQ